MNIILKKYTLKAYSFNFAQIKKLVRKKHLSKERVCSTCFFLIFQEKNINVLPIINLLIFEYINFSENRERKKL